MSWLYELWSWETVLAMVVGLVGVIVVLDCIREFRGPQYLDEGRPMSRDWVQDGLCVALIVLNILVAFVVVVGGAALVLIVWTAWVEWSLSVVSGLAMVARVCGARCGMLTKIAVRAGTGCG